MTLQDHKVTILGWIKSCHTAEQLKLSLEAIDQFISKRFEGKVAPLELAMAEADLGQAIRDREKQIIVTPPEVIAPTLERYNHLTELP